MQSIEIRMVTEPQELQTVVELQKVYWGDEGEALVPMHMLLSLLRYGGHIHGAFDGQRMVGALIGFLGVDEHYPDMNFPQRLLVMSKRMIVLPEYRGKKIGEQLKLAQADYARSHGIQLVTWTYDPLLARNAYLNLHKLGAVGQYYKADYFGPMTTDSTLSGDRLIANWWLHIDATPTHRDVPQANQTKRDGPFLVPEDFTVLDVDAVHFEIPVDFEAIREADPDLAAAWRAHVRDAFTAYFARGFVASDFWREADERVAYLFTRNSARYAFQAT